MKETLRSLFDKNEYKLYFSSKEESKMKKIVKDIDVSQVIAFKDLSTFFKPAGYIFTMDFAYIGERKIALKGLNSVEYISGNQYRCTYDSSNTVELPEDAGNQLVKLVNFINEQENKGREYYNNQDYANAVKCLSIPVYYGKIGAINILAVCYEFGAGVKKNVNKAIELYQSIFPYDVGEFKNADYLIKEGNADFKRGFFLRAYVTYKAADDKGDERAPYNIGQLYHYGKGFDKNLDEAIRWYKKALSRNPHYERVHYKLALIYKSQKNYKEMQYHLDRAPKGDALITEGLLYYNGEYYMQNIAQARHLFEIASKTNTNAFFHIALCALEKADYEGHFENLLKGYEAQDKRVLSMLGKAYEKGLGTEKDLKRAFEIYEEESKHYYTGSYHVALFFSKGLYVGKDVDKAISVLEACIAEGDLCAYAPLAQTYIDEGQYDKAIDILNKKESKDLVECAVILADCTLKGLGMQKSPDTAYNLLRTWMTREENENAKLALMKYVAKKELILSFEQMKELVEICVQVVSHDASFKNNMTKTLNIYKQQVIDKYIKGKEFEGNDAFYFDGPYRDGIYFYKDKRDYYFMDVKDYKVYKANTIPLFDLQRELANTDYKLDVGLYVKYKYSSGYIRKFVPMFDWYE